MVSFAEKLRESGEGETKAIDFATMIKEGRTKKEELSASFVGQADLGAPLTGFMDRLTIASANTLREKMDGWTRRHPEGELFRVPGTGELLARKNKSEPFSPVEGPGFEPLNDVVEFIGEDLGAIAGEVAATLGARGANLVPMLGRLFGGATLGEYGQQGIQELQGIQEEGLGEVSMRALTKGGTAATFGAAGIGVGKIYDVFSGAGITHVTNEAVEAMRAAERQGLSQLTAGQGTATPLVQKIEAQSEATIATVGEYKRQQQAAALHVFEKMRNDKEAADKLKGSLELAHNKIRGDVLASARTKAVTFEEGGAALRQGIADYELTSRFLVDELYNKARNMGDATYDLGDLMKAIAEVEFGVPAARTGGDGVVQLSGDIGQTLRGVIRDIRDMDPSLPTIMSPDGIPLLATDQLRALRTRLWDAKTAPIGEFRNEHRLAGKLYKAITDVLNSPVSANKGATEAWKRANSEAMARYRTLDKLMIIEASKTETPSIMAARLASPNQIDNIKTLRSVVPSTRFNAFQESFKLNLLERAHELTTRLKSFDKATLDSLLTPEEQRIYRDIGARIDQLNSLGVREAAAKTARVGEFIGEILVNKDARALKQISNIIAANGGPAGPLGKSVRAGLIEHIWESTITMDKGFASIDSKALASTMRQLRESGIANILTPGDMFTINDLDIYLQFISARSDVGTSMAAGSAAGGWRGALTGDVKMSAVRTVIEHMGMGRFLISDLGRGLLIGRGRPVSDKRIPAVTAAILGLGLVDMERAQDHINKLSAAMPQAQGEAAE